MTAYLIRRIGTSLVILIADIALTTAGPRIRLS